MPQFEPAPCPKLQGSVDSPPDRLEAVEAIVKDRLGRAPPPEIYPKYTHSGTRRMGAYCGAIFLKAIKR